MIRGRLPRRTLSGTAGPGYPRARRQSPSVLGSNPRSGGRELVGVGAVGQERVDQDPALPRGQVGPAWPLPLTETDGYPVRKKVFSIGRHEVTTGIGQRPRCARHPPVPCAAGRHRPGAFDRGPITPTFLACREPGLPSLARRVAATTASLLLRRGHLLEAVRDRCRAPATRSATTATARRPGSGSACSPGSGPVSRRRDTLPRRRRAVPAGPCPVVHLEPGSRASRRRCRPARSVRRDDSWAAARRQPGVPAACAWALLVERCHSCP